MENRSDIRLYKQTYVDTQFERAGLFKAIQEKYDCNTVLYPGSFVHITPSLYFPHVVYLDQNPVAQQFFADTESILAYLNRNRNYKRLPYLSFISQDYSKSVPLQEESFDLLLSLYTGGVSQWCKKYLKTGGILLSNNHHNDGKDAVGDPEYELVSVVRFRGGKYKLDESRLGKMLTTKIEEVSSGKRYLRRNNNGVEYTEPEEYYIFRRCHKEKRGVRHSFPL